MKIRHISKVLIALLFTTSCGDYLDVIPDNIPTIDHAFMMRPLRTIRRWLVVNAG